MCRQMHNRVYWHIPYRTIHRHHHPQETMSQSTGSSPPCSLLGINFYDSPPFEYGRHSLAWVRPGHKSLASSHHMACCFGLWDCDLLCGQIYISIIIDPFRCSRRCDERRGGFDLPTPAHNTGYFRTTKTMSKVI